MEAVMVHSSPPRAPASSSPPPTRPGKRTLAATGRAVRKASGVPSSQLPKTGRGAAPTSSSSSTAVSTTSSSTLSTVSAKSKRGFGYNIDDDLEVTPRRTVGGMGKGKGKETGKERGREGAHAHAHIGNRYRLSAYDAPESPDMPTPPGIRNDGVRIPRKETEARMAAFHKVQATLNGAPPNEMHTPPRKKTRKKVHDSPQDSPDPIDCFSSPPHSPTPSPTRQPLRAVNNHGDERRKAGPSKTTATSSKGLSNRKLQKTSSSMSAISVASSSGKVATDTEDQPTPKPKRALPSIKKKWEPVYTNEEWETSQAQAELASIKDPHSFFGLMSNPAHVKIDTRDKIREEARKKAEEEDLKEAEEDMRLSAQRNVSKATSDQAAAFFANVGKAPAPAPSLRQKAFTRVKSEPDGVHSSPAQATPTKAFSSLSHFASSPVVPAALTADQKYCAGFRDSSNLCPYCSEPLPKSPSSDLTVLQDRLHTMGRKGVDWRLTTAFCGLHRAETTVIPLGWRDGYPKTIDFHSLDSRVESGFVHLRLRHIIDTPDDSKFFRRTARQILSKGIAAWQGVSAQASALAFATPGYYGEIGQKVLIHHFQQLFQWGLLPSLATKAIQPLSPSDFIVMVLVPEAVTLLIMGDRGWSSKKCKGDQWKRAREEALEIRQNSAEYGRWRFREQSEQGRKILETMLDAERVRDKRNRLERNARDRDMPTKRSSITRRTHTNDDLIDIASSCSDTGSADPSEYGGTDDEAFWGEAAAISDTAGGKASFTKNTVNDNTPRAPRVNRLQPESQSSSFASLDDDGFWREAVASDHTGKRNGV